ncbi:MAG: hypothetical protein J0I98_11340 [Mesorhizobium sp.]|nr:hypothetical protein [Mesorhizobium sp.]MBN9243378.1 hypothetical protein [Mesorhizobium sp.]
MKFVPTDELLYWWPIKIPVPHPDRPGQWKTETFEMQFRAVDEDRIRELQEEYAALKNEAERLAHQDDQLFAAAVDWRGVVDDEKEPVPFSQEMLLAMLRAAVWYRSGVYDSYHRSLVSDAARRGN